MLKDSTLISFYKNQKIFAEGKINKNNQRIGFWNFYTPEGKLSEMREYFLIKNKMYLNQNIYFSSESEEYWLKEKDFNFNKYSQRNFSSDTLNETKTNYVQFDLGKDSLKLNEPWRAVAFYYTPSYKKEESQVVVILGDFNEDFSNIVEKEKDTFYSLRKDVENQRWFPEDNLDYTVAFGKWFETPGSKKIRGYLSEYYTIKGEIKEKRIYFEKDLFVRDSLK